MDFQIYIVIMILSVLLLSSSVYLLLRNKSVAQKGFFGLLLTIWGGIVLVMNDEGGLLMNTIAYILLVEGSLITLWATLFSHTRKTR